MKKKTCKSYTGKCSDDSLPFIFLKQLLCQRVRMNPLVLMSPSWWTAFGRTGGYLEKLKILMRRFLFLFSKWKGIQASAKPCRLNCMFSLREDCRLKKKKKSFAEMFISGHLWEVPRWQQLSSPSSLTSNRDMRVCPFICNISFQPWNNPKGHR